MRIAGLRKSVWMPSPFTRGDGGLVMPRRSGRNVVHSHCALRRGPAHHLGRIAKIERVADVALGERCANVLEPFGQLANLGRASARRALAKPVARARDRTDDEEQSD